MALESQVTAVIEMVWDLQQAIERTQEYLEADDVELAKTELNIIQQSLDITNMPALREATVSRRRLPGT